MNPLRVYEYLTIARGRLFNWVRPLDAEQYGRDFPIGLRTLARTLTHIMICEFAYVERMCGRPLAPYSTWPIQDEQPPPFAELEAAWRKQERSTRQALAAIADWDREFEYRVTPDVTDTPKAMIVTATYGDIAIQMALHEVHHRAQAMFMLRQLGIKAEDLDYNALMYRRREA